MFVLIAGPSLALPVNPPFVPCLATDCDRDFPSYDWQGESQNLSVSFPSRATGAILHGKLFAPADASVGAEFPAVVILPGSSGLARESHYRWAARDLAGHGYIALTVDPQGVGQSETFAEDGCTAAAPPCPGIPYQQFSVWLDAGLSAVDFLISSDNPFRDVLDQGTIGAAGHSLGARAVSVLQAIDGRVDAVVAWDNLASNSAGDEGSASGGGAISSLVGGEIPDEGQPVSPRVPAMGHATDGQGFSVNVDPDKKKTAYHLWRDSGVPSMELVFNGTPHGTWAQTGIGVQNGAEEDFFRFAHYTRAWFDLWLLEEPTALERLLSQDVDGVSRVEFLSPKWHSAAYLPDAGVDCPDLRSC